ncbi:SufD family Fe-S cluster assembly protein [Candidatus Amesbacteria bacterium]|nr:SufD family Fe-S cluster assembly protein [Candidatus Amesbacteria bacterium]
MWIRALGQDEARMDASCLIKIEELAHYTDSHLKEAILSLSKKNSLKTKPFLEILNNEVQCSHAATIGTLDDEAIYYMKNRGLDDAQAKAMLTQGFFRALLPHISNQKIKTLFKLFLTPDSGLLTPD